ncbi:hypothetical protein CC2G_010833 [Coprinopsis cinerea AmutBmut pab1-1]|nr:hypothetical protein CC2G_010833 [Coprinopsis cinerea AmutBmut pab1-1]
MAWKKEDLGSRNGAPPTPESPAAELTPIGTTSVVHASIEGDLDSLNKKLTDTVDAGVSALTPHLGADLQENLLNKAKNLRNFYEALLSMQEVAKAVQDQSESMSSIRDEYNAHLLRIEDVKQRFSTLSASVLSDRISEDDSKAEELSIKSDLGTLQDEVSDFIDGLSKRVKFVSKTASPTRAPFLRRNKSELDVLSLEDSSATPQPTVVLPLDLSQLDAEVRAESNGYVMRLSGALDSVARAAEHLTTTQLAKTLDASLASTIDTVYQSQEHTKTLKASFTSLLDSAPSPSSTTASSDTFMKDLDTLIEQVDEASRTRRLSVSRCFSPLRDLLRKMDASSSNLDDSIRQTLHVARVRSVDDVERRYHSWAEEISNLKSEMVAAKAKEVQRLEQLRIEEEKRKEEEERRKREEEDERRRKEEEERKREEERKAEEERQKELERLQEERRRKEAEEAERARLEKERLEEEERERRRLEEEAAKARALEEQERMKQNEEDKARLLAEKLAMQTKLQQAEALLAEEKARQAAREKHAQKLAEEEKLKIEAERKEMQQAIKDAQEQLARIEAEAQKAVGEEKKKLEAEIKAMKAQHDKTLEAYKTAKDSKRKEPKVKETKPRPTKDEEATPRPRRQSASSAVTPRPRRPTVTGRKNVKDQFPTINEDDVFTHSTAPSSSRMATVKENNQTHALISGLRKRLRSLNINEVARPSKKSASLPTRQRAESLRKKFADIEKDVSELPSSYDNNSLNSELRSLLTEVEGSASLLDHIDKLVVVTEAIEQCDTILSDLLEHVDSYPDIPVEISTLHTSDEEATPEQQMEARLTFTRRTLDELRTKCGTVPHDRRVLAEQARLEQTWMELDEMASDRLGGRKSRPPSAISSRPDSSRSSFSSSVAPGRPGVARKRASYAGLSVSSTTRGGKLAPPVPSTRRAVSGDSDTRRSSSRMSSTSTTRSVSGPLSTSVMAPTFASRQRTASLSSNSGTPVRQTPTAGTPSSRSRSRAQSAARLSRTRSPTVSDVSSPSYVPPARSTATSTSSWARAPRDSLSSLVARAMTPPSQRGRTPPPRKKYVANPKSKLDVAVGDVVNSLPVGINVEGVKESWRDQSGKYWIGNQDPKLCFCRILRSQTVMVRVGGGWMELSKFIQNHFADSFKLLPDSPSGLPGKQQDEKWISAASLLEAAAESKNPVIATSPPPGEGSTTGSPQLLVPPAPPKTPEPSSNGPYVPSFSLITPSGQSPRSLMGSPVQSPSVKGSSPLTPLEFMRKAEPIPHFTRPGTPSKASRTRNTPASLPSSSRAAYLFFFTHWAHLNKDISRF